MPILRKSGLPWQACLFANLLMAATSRGAAAQERALNEPTAIPNRIALLIGNSKYSQAPPGKSLTAFNVLANPCNDVTRVSALLERAGWVPGKDIIEVCDATRSKLRDAVDQFKDAYLSSGSSFGFIYYAGHGLQLGADMYLFGVDSAIDVANAANVAATHNGANLFKGGVRLFADVISQIGDAGDGSIFVVIDACRETPIDRFVRSSPDLAIGYAAATQNYREPALGIKLLYSTTRGRLASDGLVSGSPFALAFEEQLEQEGRVDALVGRVIRAVSRETRNSAVPQTPDTTGSLNPPPPDGCLTRCESKP